MKRDKAIVFGSLMFCMAAVNCFADDVTVAGRLTLRANGSFTTKTSAITAEPELPAPIFHFDVRQTNDWVWYNAEKTRVTKIPSLAGARYLKGGDGVSGANGIDGGNWVGADTVHRAPAYSFDESLGEHVLDFGKFGDSSTFYGMLFDPVDFSEAQDGSALTNVLQGVGSVVAVWYSGPERGRGDILGGGNKSFSTVDTFQRRNWCRMDPTVPAKFHYATPVLDSRTPTASTIVRQDGQWSSATRAGLKGGWQVLTLQPLTASNEASGVGCGGGRHSMGGFKVAEMYIFGELLEESKIAELEAYLRRKWFGDTLPGFNGEALIGEIRATSNANNHVAAKVTLDVAEGDTLSVDSLRGGHGGGGAYIKKGAGKLAVGDISTYDGALQLEEGELVATRRAVPTFDELPHGMIVRFDASDPDCATTVTEDGVAYVTCLSNLVEGATYGDGTIYARPPANTDAYRPWVLADALGGGRHVFDFGPFTNGGKRDPYDGRYLRFTTAATGTVSGGAWSLPVCTMVGVIGAQRGGGHILGYSTGGPNPFSRSDDAWMTDTSWHAASFFNASATVSGNARLSVKTNGVAYVNGVRRGMNEAFVTPGYQVVALQTTGSFASLLGGFQSERAGGMRIGEIMLFCRVLSDRELKDVQAYLYKKWFDGYTPGYGPAVEGRAHIHNLAATGSAAVTVDGAIPVRVAALTGNGSLEKRGAGTLEIERADATGKLKISGGKVRLAASPDVATASEPAKGALLHLDASDLTTLEAPYKSNILERVKYWYDKSGNGNVALSGTMARCPRLNTDDTCNGLPVMDFGEFNKLTSGFMGIARTIDSARAVYVVWGTQNGGGHLFGYTDSSWLYASENNAGSSWLDFTRKTNPTSEPGGGVGTIMDHQSSAQTVASGSIYTNGVKTVFSVVPTGDYQLFEFHTGEPASVAGINIDRNSQPGGGRYGEIIVYDRELSPRERIATRNYFLKKWFGKTDDELEALPEAEAAPLKLDVELAGGDFDAAGATVEGDISYADGSTLKIAFDADGVVTNKPSVTGTVSFGENMKVVFEGPDGFAPVSGMKLEIADVGGVAGIDNLASAEFTGYAFKKSTTPVFWLSPSGKLMMSFGRSGMVMVVR